MPFQELLVHLAGTDDAIDRYEGESNRLWWLTDKGQKWLEENA